mgnify:FL=1
MKKSELVLGNVIRGYKGEKEFTITQINEEVVILDGEKEVKVSTLLKNYKFVREAEVVEEVEEAAVEVVNDATEVEVKLPVFQLKLVAPIIAGLLPEAKVEKKVETIYGIKVVKGINQTCIWKILKKVCENKDEKGTVVANQLSKQYPDAFKGAVRCLVSKKRINYIESIIEA